MKREPTELLEEFELLDSLLPSIDAIYSQILIELKHLSPILQKCIFEENDKEQLKNHLSIIHPLVDEYTQFLRRGEGEIDLLKSEVLRVSHQNQNQEDCALAEAELWNFEQGLKVREKAMTHLSDLVQLLDSVVRVGELTEFDEKLLTEILSDLKNGV